MKGLPDCCNFFSIQHSSITLFTVLVFLINHFCILLRAKTICVSLHLTRKTFAKEPLPISLIISYRSAAFSAHQGSLSVRCTLRIVDDVIQGYSISSSSSSMSLSGRIRLEMINCLIKFGLLMLVPT